MVFHGQTWVGLLDCNFIDPEKWLHCVHPGGGAELVLDSVSQGGPWAEGGSLCSWAFKSGGQSFKPTILRTHLSIRCMKLQIQFAFDLIGKELNDYSFLLRELEDHLLEVEENFIFGGYHKNYVDLKIEHAKIKR